jgi:curved DNA-binding protein
MRTVKKETSTDYYEILQLSSTADQDMIERAYRILAKRYHPDNIDTGDRDKFAKLMEAYHALSDSETRAAYDTHPKGENDHQDNFFFNVPQPDESDAETRLYQAILLILYIARRKDVVKPGVGGFQLEKLLGLPEKELEFYIWYLKEKRWIEHTETGGFAITASGVDAVIEKNIILRKDRLLPYADESSLNCAESKEPKPSAKPTPDDPSDQLFS